MSGGIFSRQQTVARLRPGGTGDPAWSPQGPSGSLIPLVLEANPTQSEQSHLFICETESSANTLGQLRHSDSWGQLPALARSPCL